MFIVNPIRKLYILIIKKILNGKSSSNNRLILYRLDKDNIFLTDKRNISGETVGAAYNTIDSMSIKFYRYIEKLRSCKTILIKDMQCKIFKNIYNPIKHGNFLKKIIVN